MNRKTTPQVHDGAVHWGEYSAYRDTGHVAVGVIPSHWEMTTLGRVGDFSASGIDKKSSGDELPVRMVNYTDVYQSSSISGEEDLMTTTAPGEKVVEYGLREGDILFTPSSETPEEIGFSAVVVSNLPVTVYSYHLIRFRPRIELFLPFEKYWCRNAPVLSHFRAVCKGTTRQILTRDNFKTAPAVIPPLSEQKAIANFLDHETSRIDKLIDRKKCLTELLEEKCTALVTRAVTKGLDPDVPMKDPGVGWLGEIPEHWEVAPCSALFEFLDHMRVPLSSEVRGDMTERSYPYYGASGIIDQVDDYLFDEPLVLVAEDGANLLSRSTPLAFIARGKYWVNNHAHVLRPRSGPIEFWANLLRTVDYTPLVEGAAQPKLTQSKLSSIRLPVPPENERERIVNRLQDARARVDPLEDAIYRGSELLEEYRTALISAAVTGKIDVRQAA